MTSARSSSFLKPAKAMLVPFTYSLGLASHANMVSLFHSTSAFFKTLVNLKSLADCAQGGAGEAFGVVQTPAAQLKAAAHRSLRAHDPV